MLQHIVEHYHHHNCTEGLYERIEYLLFFLIHLTMLCPCFFVCFFRVFFFYISMLLVWGLFILWWEVWYHVSVDGEVFCFARWMGLACIYVLCDCFIYLKLTNLYIARYRFRFSLMT